MSKLRILSFKNAFSGIWTALKEEPNLKFHFLAAAVAFGLGLYFNITKVEWLTLFFIVGLVVSLELTNTAIEEMVNSFTSNYHPSAKKAKDVAAGAVLIAAITALIVGFVIFFPYFAAIV